MSLHPPDYATMLHQYGQSRHTGASVIPRGTKKGKDNFKFRCQDCEVIFHDPLAFYDHNRASHADIVFAEDSPQFHATPNKCHFCSKVFKGSFTYLIGHIEDVHNGRVFQCDTCLKVIRGYPNTITHEKNCQDGGTFTLSYNKDRKETRGRKSIAEKSFVERSLPAVAAPVAPENSFDRISSRSLFQMVPHETPNQRQKTKPKLPIDPSKLIQCPLCSKLYKGHVSYLNSHMEDVHNGRVFRCNICSKDIRGYANTITHKKTHIEETTYTVSYTKLKSETSGKIKSKTLNKTKDVSLATKAPSINQNPSINPQSIGEGSLHGYVFSRNLEQDMVKAQHRLSPLPGQFGPTKDFLVPNTTYASLMDLSTSSVANALDAESSSQGGNELRIQPLFHQLQEARVCCICYTVFDSDSENYRVHLLEHAMPFYSRSFCPICKLDCLNNKKMINHFMTVHGLVQRHGCHVTGCTKSFWLKSNLDGHSKSHYS